MRDHGKCSAAVARLLAFIAEFPQSPNQTHVVQYHGIVKILEEACGRDLSRFQIAPDRVNSGANNQTRDTWQTPFVASTLVEHSHFCSQLRALMGYATGKVKFGAGFIRIGNLWRNCALGETDAANQVCESRVGADRIKERMHFEELQNIVALLKRCKSLLVFAQT